MKKTSEFISGLKAGIPIGVGYFSVAFALGIAAAAAGLTSVQAATTSFFCIASAGEYAAFSVFSAGGSYIELIIMELVSNARYILMSCTLSQRFSPKMSVAKRLVVGYFLTDEIFAVNISSPGYISLARTLGAASVSVPGWTIGTFLGVVAGNILPERVVSALSVGLFGMFIAIIIPPCKNDKAITVTVITSFALSALAAYLPYVSKIPSGIRTIILTVLISLGAALLFPVPTQVEKKNGGTE